MRRLSARPRTLLLGASLFLAAAGFLPLWRVTLQAPQYPEGLGMRIRANTITGAKENDLENINNLNHYIGMKRIIPESIPELRYMPWVIGTLVGLGLVVALVGRRLFLTVWVALFLTAALGGLADFWRWEYTYGHDLDMENAIIKIPGMNYQPPLIGTRQLLNFRATSMPDIGGILAVASLGLGVAALFSERRSTRRAELSPAHPALTRVA